MNPLSLRYEACVRSLSVNSSCTRCRDACPESAIRTDGERGTVRVSLSHCTGCGVCVAECPTDAFELASPVLEALERPATEEGVRRLACGEAELPCIGSVSAEDLVAMAARGETVELVDGACRARDPGHARAAARAEEAARLVEALGLPGRVRFRPDPALAPPDPTPRPLEEEPEAQRQAPASPGRRQLLRMLVPRLDDEPAKSLEAPLRLDRSRMQQVPARRRRLLASLPSGVEARVDCLDEGAVTITSSKRLVTERCTACSICFSVCPTGALSAPRSLKEIRFDASRCTKCRLCHDVCATDAMTLAERTSLEEFVERAPRSLGRLPVTSCGECGARFVRADPAQGRCPRCAEMEDEAKDLWGIER